MRNPSPLHFEDAYKRIADLSQRRQGFINDYAERLSEAADAKHNFRAARAKAYALAASEGGTADQKKIRADELASEAEHAHDIADALSRAALERIRACEADRSMLRALLGWSMRLAQDHGEGR